MKQDMLPTSVKELRALGYERPDVVLFTGDAYIDHPSFGAAVIGRVLQAAGYVVAIVPQPNWRDDLRDFKKFGEPGLFFGVTAGAMDSMVNHYTANLRLRSDDAYTPGGAAGFRPDRALTVYCKILKELWPNVPVIAGGIEASLRRLTHYDYWSNSLRPSVLAECGADALIYGMGEKTIVEVARALENGFNARKLRTIPQVALMADRKYVEGLPQDTVRLHSFERCVKDPAAFGENFVKIETESNRRQPGAAIVEGVGDRFVVVNPPTVFSGADLDAGFDLPYARAPHPRYRDKHIPAWEMIRDSVCIHRGCFGGCSFCAISAHQGKFVVSRSKESVLREVDAVAAAPGFKGNLSDVGGPSANMFSMGGKDTAQCDKCLRPSCAWPSVCGNLQTSHAALLDLYDAVARRKGVRHAYIGSGIRYDLMRGQDGARYLEEVVARHLSGRLKVAPEHSEPHVLKAMRKPPFELFEQLCAEVDKINRRHGLKTSVTPYLISSHPGCTQTDMERLARRIKPLGCYTEPAQDFTPTPMTLSSVIYYTGRDPYTSKPVFSEHDQERKRMQKSCVTGGGARKK